MKAMLTQSRNEGLHTRYCPTPGAVNKSVKLGRRLRKIGSSISGRVKPMT